MVCSFFVWHARRELNPRTRLRRPALYPLSYGRKNTINSITKLFLISSEKNRKKAAGFCRKQRKTEVFLVFSAINYEERKFKKRINKPFVWRRDRWNTREGYKK